MQLVGGLVTAVLALGVLFWLNWRLTAAILGVLVLFAGMLSYAFRRLRPIFRERNKIQAEITGRLGESLGGVRVVKAYTAEKFEETSLRQRHRSPVREHPQHDERHRGRDSASTALVGRRRRDHDGGRRTLDPRRLDDAGRFHHVHLLQRPAGRAGSRDRRDRNAAERGSSPASTGSARFSARRRKTTRTRRGGRSRSSAVKSSSRTSGSSTSPKLPFCAASRSGRRPARRPRSSAPRAPARAPSSAW